ncbi:bifunctional 2-C-methyl-D-erythritol 4-phosphate cytidylyltransferase/2-C-methyl-D-erythritol 2,4-cyclodiphosphate synthase [Sphingomonas sp.]|uniref:bifunctional 2-C-methyl-D-erythritol 4-phosphate cytidylyltransferase/2-C-methyl-D-erythritol 2,4-cyclodiphosphate synthase n=1 Tax=Sphingomonas sp. TaxID=28214 RepID=UPI003CC6628A
MSVAAIIVAAGSGIRAGGALPKQFTTVAGLPMVAHSYRVLRAHPAIAEIVIVVGEGQDALARTATGEARLSLGGATRRESVRNGLAALTNRPARVLVHDAARPFVPAAVVDRLLFALDTHDGAVPVLAVADTLVSADGETVDRAPLRRVQTPQAFRRDELLAAHAAWSGPEPTDDAQMVRALGGSVALVQGDPMLDKVTYPEDFAIAEARAQAFGTWEWRSATGFDVHRLAAGEELWLGGVLIPHDRGLSGHSDADVALHALTDALLGTIAAGDIGTHFPPSDPQWKGAASHRFLTHAAGLIAARGGQVSFVDLTLICEAPKIGPHRAAMQARIAELLRLTPDRVSVKATTTEQLGFTGRGEGIAAQASATVRLPAGAPR